MLPTIYYLVLALCLVLIYYQMRSPSNAPKPPPYPGALPLIGHTHMLLGSTAHAWRFVSKIHHACYRLGGVVALNLSVQTLYVVTDPDDIQTIANACLDKHYAYKFTKPWLGYGLLTSDAIVWKLHRKLLNPAFNQQILNGFIGVFNDQARRLVEHLSPEVGNGPIIPDKFLVSSIWETISQTVLNLHPTSNQKNNSEKYSECTDQILEIYTTRFQKPWLHIPFVYRWSAYKRKDDALTRTLINISSSIIKNRKLELQQQSNSRPNVDHSSDKFKPLLDMMLELVESKQLTDEEIRQELDTIIFAGYDTTATTLGYVLVLLGSHAGVQQRAWNEIQEVMGDSYRDVGKHDFPKLVYLEAVIKETLRLYTTVAAVARTVTKAVQLRNYVLPEGSNCALLFYGLHRHPMWGPDREQFRPERWLDPATLPDHPNAFAGFSVGKRSCIGRIYAMMWLKTMLVHVLRRYRVTADVSKLVLKMDVMLKPSTGQEIQLDLRV